MNRGDGIESLAASHLPASHLLQSDPVWRQRRGFTLPELLVLIALFAITLAISAPSMGSRVEAYRADTAMRNIAGLITYARQEALLRGEPVTMCATNTDGACDRHWDAAKEIRIFRDANENRRVDSDEEVLRMLRWPLSDGSLIWRAAFGRTYIEFEANGGTWQNGTLLYCPASGAASNARALVLSQSGRAYPSLDTNGDGVHENREGVPLRC